LKKARLTKGFTPAKDYNAIEYPPAGRFGVAICYEVIFPAMVRKISNLGTDFLVTITNDSWFGDTSAPHQHVDQVAMRAIELRRSFARAANTGISCVVDATGKVRSETETYVRTYAVDEIQTLSIRSIYSRIGDLFVYLMITALALCGIIAFRNRGKAKGELHVR
jgi:apolipoprotein N-acyltransferase